MMEHIGSGSPIESPNTEKPTCPYCRQPAVTKVEDGTFTYGLDHDAVEIPVKLPVRRCDACDFEFLDHVAERIQTEAVYCHRDLLTPWEIRAIRERRKLSRAAFAEITGLGEATIKRWETGAIEQNRANDNYLRLLDTYFGWRKLKRLGIVARESTPEDLDHVPDSSVITEERVILDTPRMQLEYWTRFLEVLAASNVPSNRRHRSPQHRCYISIPIGRGGFCFGAVALKPAMKKIKGGELRVDLFITHPDEARYFKALKRNRDAIESELGFPLEWEDLPGKKSSRLAIRRYIDSGESWLKQHKWLVDHVNRMHEVLVPRVKRL